MAAPITRSQLRELLHNTLRTDSDFSAFVLDQFPEVYRSFSGSQDRTSRFNLLLESVDTEEILRALLLTEPSAATKLATLAASTNSTTATTATAAGSVNSNPADLPAQPARPAVPAAQSASMKLPPKFILHLSDLHFTERDQATGWYTQLLLDLKQQMGIAELFAVVISGDITNHATTEQFGYAQQFLERLCKTFGVGKQRLLIVPGNHDVNWKLTGEGTDGFSPFAAFHRAVCDAEYPSDYASQATLRHFPDQNLLLLGLNSAWRTDHANPSRAGLHKGAFGHAIGSILENEEYQLCNKLAVWHHPPSELSLEGGLDGAVLQQLAQAGFRLVLHGHVHRADNTNFRYYRQGPHGSVEILTAGTFGAPTHELVPGYPFQYQVLEFRGDLLTVHTRKREDEAGGWMADHRWQQAPGQNPDNCYQITLRSGSIEAGPNAPQAQGIPPQMTTSTVEQTARASAVFSDGAPIHWVDRTEQTRQIKKIVAEREHNVVLLPGPQGEAHELFLTRIEQVIPRQPSRQTMWVHWPKRESDALTPYPPTKSEMMAALTQAIQGSRGDSLEARLAHHLHHHDLLVLHSPVDRKFGEDSILLDYYTVWIPEVLSGLQTRYHCKLVQPISWRKEQSFWDRVRGNPSPKQDAIDFMQCVEQHAAKQLPVRRLIELAPILHSDVMAFLVRCKYAERLSPVKRDAARQELADKIMAGKVNSEQILRKLSTDLTDWDEPGEDHDDDDE